MTIVTGTRVRANGGRPRPHSGEYVDSYNGTWLVALPRGAASANTVWLPRYRVTEHGNGTISVSGTIFAGGLAATLVLGVWTILE